MADNFSPPIRPPPLLSILQLQFLAYHGHLQLSLSPQLYGLYKDLSDATGDFFARSEATKKAQYPSEKPELGYYNAPGEKEYLSLRYFSSTGDERVEVAAKQVWVFTGALMRRIFTDIAEGLQVSPEVWDPVLEDCLVMPRESGSVERDLPTVLRMFRYEPESGKADPHTDTGLLTLCLGNGKGLQVYNRPHNGTPGAWNDADGPTLLVGQALRALTSNRINSGLHRVEGNPRGRTSTIFALRPCLRNTIDMTALQGKGQVDLRRLYTNIQDSRYNINLESKEKEKQRQQIRRLALASTN